MAEVAGLVLAAGRGQRFGGPKALATTPDGRPWLTEVATTLIEAGLVVSAVVPPDLPQATDLLPSPATAVTAPPISAGLSDSLRAGLDALDRTDVAAVLIVPVDVPTMPTSAVERIITVAPVTGSSLRRAVYGGHPGHPVLLGRDHWAGARAASQGDHGAGAYLHAAGALEVECGDLWSGDDIDHR
jgi:CTP:molybdopterin cytidylyltransferase MocA